MKKHWNKKISTCTLFFEKNNNKSTNFILFPIFNYLGFLELGILLFNLNFFIFENYPLNFFIKNNFKYILLYTSTKIFSFFNWNGCIGKIISKILIFENLYLLQTIFNKSIALFQNKKIFNFINFGKITKNNDENLILNDAGINIFIRDYSEFLIYQNNLKNEKIHLIFFYKISKNYEIISSKNHSLFKKYLFSFHSIPNINNVYIIKEWDVFENFLLENIKKQKYYQAISNTTYFKIIPKNIFKVSNPSIFGIELVSGKINVGDIFFSKTGFKFKILEIRFNNNIVSYMNFGNKFSIMVDTDFNSKMKKEFFYKFIK